MTKHGFSVVEQKGFVGLVLHNTSFPAEKAFTMDRKYLKQLIQALQEMDRQVNGSHHPRGIYVGDVVLSNEEEA